MAISSVLPSFQEFTPSQERRRGGPRGRPSHHCRIVRITIACFVIHCEDTGAFQCILAIFIGVAKPQEFAPSQERRRGGSCCRSSQRCRIVRTTIACFVLRCEDTVAIRAYQAFHRRCQASRIRREPRPVGAEGRAATPLIVAGSCESFSPTATK